MNKHFFNEINIKNFKSLKDINIACKRLNLFIGEPNVGKSNIIEALSMFDGSILNSGFFLKEYCRYVQLYDLFYEQNINEPIIIETDINLLVLRTFKEYKDYYFVQFIFEKPIDTEIFELILSFDGLLKELNEYIENNLKK